MERNGIKIFLCRTKHSQKLSAIVWMKYFYEIFSPLPGRVDLERGHDEVGLVVDQLGHQPVPAPVHDAAPRAVLDQSESSIVSRVSTNHSSPWPAWGRSRSWGQRRTCGWGRHRSRSSIWTWWSWGSASPLWCWPPLGHGDTPARNIGLTLYFVRTYTKVSFEIPSSDKFYWSCRI